MMTADSDTSLRVGVACRRRRRSVQTVSRGGPHIPPQRRPGPAGSPAQDTAAAGVVQGAPRRTAAGGPRLGENRPRCPDLPTVTLID